jgi:hypothetical protein
MTYADVLMFGFVVVAGFAVLALIADRWDERRVRDSRSRNQAHPWGDK